jgi:hypothetical protein
MVATKENRAGQRERAMLAFKQNAVLSDCGLYRYVLTRQVGPQNRIITFIMLNPSTADAVKNDQTIRKCIGFARLWECGRLVVVNLFAFRTTDPAEMRQGSCRTREQGVARKDPGWHRGRPCRLRVGRAWQLQGSGHDCARSGRSARNSPRCAGHHQGWSAEASALRLVQRRACIGL